MIQEQQQENQMNYECRELLYRLCFRERNLISFY